MTADRVALEDVTPAVAAVFGTNNCLIWSGEHGAWWRGNCQGYTTDRRMAGRYTIATAYDATSHCGPEKGIAFVQLAAEDWRHVPARAEVIEGILARHYPGAFSLDKAVAAEIAAALSTTLPSLWRRAIEVECTNCDRRLMIERDPTDPPAAALMRLQCDRCDDGDRHAPEYFDADGQPINPVAHLAGAAAAAAAPDQVR